ncbi:hypothetical protein N2152v2_009588 [Parachlorella kessleri]
MVSCTAETQQAVSEIRQAFSSLLEGFHFAFVVSNPREPDNPIVYASSSFFELTGYSPAEVLGRNCRFLQGPETSHQAVLEIRDAIREDRPCSTCLVNYKKDGTKFWNAFYLEPIRCVESGCVLYYVGAQADVTQLVEQGGAQCVATAAHEEQQRAEQVRRQLSDHRQEWQQAQPTCAADSRVPSSMLCALSKIQDCFVLADPNLPDCPIVYASPTFLRMTGYPCSEVLGRNCRFLQGPGTDPVQVANLRDAMAACPPRAVTVTLLNYRKSGEPFWNCLHVAPVRDADGRVQFYAGVQLDITAHHETVQQAAASAAAALATKGIVGAVRVAARALSRHGLRRAPAFQQPPHHAVGAI